ncbi:cytoplasmic dynein 2 heavy chain 1-like [Anthonomus grandis grandis]|uniref:cytoplasmic dynein 2 heavy chain 1-like n=1 Tax=Anthonomus grandis grandis TaxID=2921223 RepID=UPI0021651205|nr:cytoplasmic dynein 2 heavy chain 1-like [Anthonomus grandis grandis]
MEGPFKKSLIQISRLQLGQLNTEDLSTDQIEGVEHLRQFLENDNNLTVYSYLSNNGNLIFSEKLPNFDVEKALIFNKPTPISTSSGDFLKRLQVNSISGKPTLDLLGFLNKIFAPSLQKHYDKSTIRNILALQSNLRNVIVTENALEYQNQSDFSVLNFYNQPFYVHFSIIESLTFLEVEDLLERCHNTLDDLWRCDPGFPKDRMRHLMDIIGSDVWKHSVKQLGDCDIFKDDYNKVLEKSVQCITLAEKWLTTCTQLTGLFWPNYIMNPWKEDVYQPIELLQFVSTLREVINVRTVHKQLLRLSTAEEQNDLSCDKVFKPFEDVDVLRYDDAPPSNLKRALKEFEGLLRPAEERVGFKLKKQLMTVNANTRQLLYEFTRYSELINRPVLKETLKAERQFLLKSLSEYIGQIQNQSNLEITKIATRQETSETIREIIHVRQLEAKANEVLLVVEKLLDDLEGYVATREFTMGVLDELKSQHTELFDAWSSDIVADINSNKLSLKETDPVIQFSRDKLMKVNYSARLITLIAEVRQLRAMGYHIPSLVEETSEHAKKFMKFAKTLEQIANFHNTIGNRMIPCQKPLMLTSALELSKLVQEQEVVSWGEEKHVEKYVDTLRKTVEKLSQSNNLLTGYYVEIIEKIKELENVSLLKDLPRWTETIKNIRTIIANVENKGYKNLQQWKSEVDIKICEVLEREFAKNLNSLHLSLEEIRVDLVYRNSELDFSPNKQTLEQMYEQQLKKYLNIPKTFKGISDNAADIYSKIIERNEDILAHVSKKKNDLFKQLDDVANHWKSWLQLDPLDPKKLTTWQHWDLHFRASKTFGQEIAKLPSTEEKLGCFTICLSRLRSDLESHNRSYWDQLVYSLKDSIAEDVVKLQNYIDPSTAALTKQPVTLEEIGESGFKYSSVISAHGEMETTFKEMLNKSQTLASWSREQVDSVNRLKGAWERLGSLINNHQHIMAKQMETIKTSLNIEQENVLKEIERFEAKWSQISSNHNSFDTNTKTIEGVNKLFQEIKTKRKEWSVIVEKRNCLNLNYDKFSLEKPDIAIAEEVEKALKEEEESWKLFEEFNTDFEKYGSQYWIVFRKKHYELEDFINSWEDKFTIKPKPDYAPVILQELQNYKDIVPVLKYVKGEDFSEKHWNDLFHMLNQTPKATDQILLKDFLNAHEEIKSCAKQLQDLCKKAASEIVIRQALKDIDQWEAQTKFVLAAHQDSRGKSLMLVKKFKDVLNAIGDHQILLQSLKHSSTFDSFAEKSTSWETKLENLNGHLNSLAQIQKRWLYLEPIFGSGTLAQEKVRFDRLDKDFRKIMTFIEKDTRVTEICKYPNVKAILESILEQLTRCQHSLDDFLKVKREAFSRFLFLSDDDLLEIVGQSSKEQVIQTHLRKLFAGIHSVKLDTSGDNIVAMCSLQGEEVRLGHPVAIRRPVEEWLGELVKVMQITLKELLVNCQRETQAPDPLKYPSQILCLSDNISFTLKCEQALSSMSLTTLLAKYKAQLNELSSLELNSDVSNTLELKLKSLLIDTIHHIRVLEELLNRNVTKVSEWTWQKQLRYYANSVGDVTVKMGKARMNYSYEYLGNDPKLVRTPLTERCFLTLTQAMHLGLGGNPYGPAGTGKTESVKALGAMLGRQVLVFNCDEGIDANSMERILIGLAKTGAWGCFDEFNRLDETTLSAISMHIHIIQDGLKNNVDAVQLGDQQVRIDKHCGIFVTLNPAGAEYGGRNKLPDNLKQLFRPIVMTHPDHEEIARTCLHCDGYRYADVIAKKIVEVFDMSRNLMSKQQHYDWGLRAIKSILSGCQAAIKQHNQSENKSGNSLDQGEEFALVVSTLKTDISSKLTFSDALKFSEIIGNVFKGVPAETVHDDALKKIIVECYRELNLIINEQQINKCLEFYKQLKQRMGVALIGPPSSGKTTIIQIVSRAVAKLNQKIKLYPVNPKSVSRQLLLGHMDHLNQWNDGILTSYSLQVSSEPEVYLRKFFFP